MDIQTFCCYQHCSSKPCAFRRAHQYLLPRLCHEGLAEIRAVGPTLGIRPGGPPPSSHMPWSSSLHCSEPRFLTCKTETPLLAMKGVLRGVSQCLEALHRACTDRGLGQDPLTTESPRDRGHLAHSGPASTWALGLGLVLSKIIFCTCVHFFALTCSR